MPSKSLWHQPLLRELATVLLLKLFLLYGLWYFFFSQPTPPPDAQRLQQQLLGQTPEEKP